MDKHFFNVRALAQTIDDFVQQVKVNVGNDMESRKIRPLIEMCIRLKELCQTSKLVFDLCIDRRQIFDKICDLDNSLNSLQKFFQEDFLQPKIDAIRRCIAEIKSNTVSEIMASDTSDTEIKKVELLIKSVMDSLNCSPINQRFASSELFHESAEFNPDLPTDIPNLSANKNESSSADSSTSTVYPNFIESENYNVVPSNRLVFKVKKNANYIPKKPFVSIRGLEKSITGDQIVEFLREYGVFPKKVTVLIDDRKKCTGHFYCEFDLRLHANEMKSTLNGMIIKKRYMEMKINETFI